MLSRLRAVNSKIIILIVAVIVATAGVRFVIVSPAQNSLDNAGVELFDAQADLADLKQRVAEIQRDGNAGVSGLVSRLSMIENAVPLKVDDIALASNIATLARDAGVELRALDRSADPAEKRGTLEMQRYTFTVEGSADAIVTFISQVQSWSGDVVSIGSFQISNKVSGTSDNLNSAFEGDIVGSGVFFVWTTTLPPLTAPGAKAADAPATGTTTGTTTPGATTPGATAPGTTTPGATTPGATTPGTTTPGTTTPGPTTGTPGSSNP